MNIEDEERKKLNPLKVIFKNLRQKIDDSTSKVMFLELLELLKQRFDVLSDFDLPIKTKQLNITVDLAFYLFLGIRYLLTILKGKLTENEYQYLKEIFDGWDIQD